MPPLAHVLDVAPPSRPRQSLPALRVVDSPAERRERLLRRSTPLASLPREALSRLAETALSKQVLRGDCVWHAGDAARTFALVISGVMKLTAPTSSRGTILDLFGPGELVGLPAALRGAPYLGNLSPLTPRAEVLLVSADAMLAAMRSDAGVAIAFSAAAFDFVSMLGRKINVLSAGAVPQRIATLLLALADRFGDSADDGLEEHVPVSLSREELSLSIDAALETAIRGIRRFESEGWVETTEDGFILRDRARLTEIARS